MRFPENLMFRFLCLTCLATATIGSEGMLQAVAADEQLGSTMTLEELQKVHKSGYRHQESVPITVQPAAEPSPALKLRLYPAPWELKPGSALLHFSRAQLMHRQLPEKVRPLWQSNEWLSGEGEGERPTRKQLKDAVDAMASIYGELREFSESEDFEWDHRLRDLRGPKVYEYLLPDVQEVRTLARALQLRIRYQLMERDFDGAIESIRHGLRLAEFVGQGETLIQKLVGISIQSIMRDSLTDTIATPGCPNLYWAIAAIPRPLLHTGDSVLWELSNIAKVLPALAEAETATWTDAMAAEQWSSIIEDLQLLTGNIGDQAGDAQLALAVASVSFVEDAKKRLLANGVDKARVAKMPSLQIVLVDASHELRRIGDDLGKAHLLPIPLSRKLAKQKQQEFQQWQQDNRMSSLAAIISGLLYPAVLQAKEAEVRTEMAYHRLMTLEALRMHAANHDGQLPETLDQLDPVPAWNDPYTGKPFEYQRQSVDGQTTVTLKAVGPTNHKPLQTLRATFSE